MHNPCNSPLHTHDEPGIIHIEAAADTLLTLGQFFTEWGVRIDDECVREFCEPDTDIVVSSAVTSTQATLRTSTSTTKPVIATAIGTPPEFIAARADGSQA